MLETISNALQKKVNNRELDRGNFPIDWLDVPGLMERYSGVDLESNNPITQSIVHYQKGVVEYLKKGGYKVKAGNHYFVQCLMINMASQEEWHETIDEESSLTLDGQLTERQKQFASQFIDQYEYFRTTKRETGSHLINNELKEGMANNAQEIMTSLRLQDGLTRRINRESLNI